jgi:hypothetical protein
MTSVPATGPVVHSAGVTLLRVILTYVLPGLAVFCVVPGLWLVPESFAGMYGNHDGHWSSWYTRGILEWASTSVRFLPWSVPVRCSRPIYLGSTRARLRWRFQRRCRYGISCRCWSISQKYPAALRFRALAGVLPISGCARPRAF